MDEVEPSLGCWGRKYNHLEKHYSSTKGELLSLVKFMDEWEHYLKYQPPFYGYMNTSSLK